MAAKKHIYNQREVKPNMSNKELAETWPEVPRLDINQYKKDIIKTAETEGGKEAYILLNEFDVRQITQNGVFMDYEKGMFLFDADYTRCYFVAYYNPANDPETKYKDYDEEGEEPIAVYYNLSE